MRSMNQKLHHAASATALLTMLPTMPPHLPTLLALNPHPLTTPPLLLMGTFDTRDFGMNAI